MIELILFIALIICIGIVAVLEAFWVGRTVTLYYAIIGIILSIVLIAWAYI